MEHFLAISLLLIMMVGTILVSIFSCIAMTFVFVVYFIYTWFEQLETWL